MAKHRKGLQSAREVATRVIWNSIETVYRDQTYTSPWVFFKNKTAMDKWKKEMRKLHPTIKFDDYCYLWTVEQLTYNLKSKVKKGGKRAKERI